MPKNPIPKQNLPKVEEIRYLENQNQASGQDNHQVPILKSTDLDIKKLVRQNLIWKNEQGKNFYRVFGSWKCDNQKKKCGKDWNSAYTWILLQKYKNNVPVKELDKHKDYYQQECKSCSNKVNRLIRYEHLKLSENEGEIKPHLTELCAKCQTEAKCWDFMKYQQQVRYFSHARQVNSRFLGFGKRFFRL